MTNSRLTELHGTTTMTRSIVGCVLSIILMPLALAQNLVPNWSLEDYVLCPDSWSQFDDNVIDWSVVSNSPDYLNRCRNAPDVGVPLNNFGFQLPAHGDAYVGLCTYKVNAPFFREYISVELSEILTIGELVTLSMKVACGGFGNSTTMSAGWTSKGIGLRLSTEPFVWQQDAFPNSAHLYMTEVLQDTANWINLTTTIVCDSAYRYVAIGNFFDDETSTPQILTTEPSADAAYVFVDEICVAHGLEACDFIISSLQAVTRPSTLMVESPFADHMYIQFPSPLETTIELRLNDLEGRVVASISMMRGQQSTTWSTQALASGLYLLSAPGYKTRRVLHVSP
jgi:hypothetical protein